MTRGTNYPGLPRTLKSPVPGIHTLGPGETKSAGHSKGILGSYSLWGKQPGESGLISLPGLNHTDGRLPAGPCVPAQPGHSLGALPALLS